jgi:hypothetical protein
MEEKKRKIEQITNEEEDDDEGIIRKYIHTKKKKVIIHTLKICILSSYIVHIMYSSVCMLYIRTYTSKTSTEYICTT